MQTDPICFYMSLLFLTKEQQYIYILYTVYTVYIYKGLIWLRLFILYSPSWQPHMHIMVRIEPADILHETNVELLATTVV